MKRLGIVAVLLLAFAGCASSPAARRAERSRGAPAPTLAPMELRPGMQFRVRHRWTLGSGSQSLVQSESRGSIVVEEVDDRGGARLRVVFVRPGREAGQPEAWLVARVLLRADGRVLRDPTVLCEGDALDLERLVRHLVMPVVVEEQTLDTELIEERVRAEVEVGSRRGVRAIRARAERYVHSVEMGPHRASGRARFSLLMELGEDGLSGRRRLRTQVRGRYTDRSSGRELEGTLESESDTLVELVTNDVEATLPSDAAACVSRTRPDAQVQAEPAVTSFDVGTVIAMIGSRRDRIRACYEEQLRAQPTLSGSVRITMTILSTGAVVAVSVVQSTLGNEAVAACVVHTIESMRFDPGPADGSMTYEFPFTFAPQR